MYNKLENFQKKNKTNKSEIVRISEEIINNRLCNLYNGEYMKPSQ